MSGINCDNEIPEEILKKSSEAAGKLIPTKSADRYKKEYELFNEWKRVNQVQTINEDVMLAYMLDLVSVSIFLST